MTTLRRRMLADLQLRGPPPRPNRVLSTPSTTWRTITDGLPTRAAKKSSASLFAPCAMRSRSPSAPSAFTSTGVGSAPSARGRDPHLTPPTLDVVHGTITALMADR